MTGFVIFFALILFVAFTFMHGASRSSGGGSRRNQQRADELISAAESHIMLGRLGEAEAAFRQAAMLAAGDPLLISEAHYGLCRVCERRGDMKGAAHQIDLALKFAPQWRDYKPNFESLLKREQERIKGERGSE